MVRTDCPSNGLSVPKTEPAYARPGYIQTRWPNGNFEIVHALSRKTEVAEDEGSCSIGPLALFSLKIGTEGGGNMHNELACPYIAKPNTELKVDCSKQGVLRKFPESETWRWALNGIFTESNLSYAL